MFGERDKRRLRSPLSAICFVCATAQLGGCAPEVVDSEPMDLPGGGVSAGGMTTSSPFAGAGGTANLGGGASLGGTTTGSGAVSGSGSGGAGGISTGGASTGGTSSATCTEIKPGRAPLRRLTTYEYNNTVRELFGDTTNPGSEFPSEVLGKGFGNDADLQSVSDLLAEKYYSVAETVAARATENATALGRLHACTSSLTSGSEEACVRSITDSILPRAYRRPVTSTEVDEFVGLYRTTRGLSTSVTFAAGVSAVLSAILQSPDFLYRPEFGVAVTGNPNVRLLTGHEIATRLAYLFLQSVPDPELTRAATAGELSTPEGVLVQARRLLATSKSRSMLAFFFDNLLPLSDLSSLTRSKELFPSFSASVGAAMRQEVQRLLEYEIFENTSQVAGSPYAPGSWPAILTAPYTFVNQTLFDFYGASSFATGASVTGTALQRVEWNTSQRLGLLTQAGMMAGTATTNLTNPVLRGGFVVKHLMCRDIPLPSFAVAPPEPYTGKTARERFGKHSADEGCSGCHRFMDPIGLALENFDAVGRYRVTERTTIDGVTYDTPIDASGSVPGVAGTANGPVELVRLFASSEEVQSCFATNWMQFAMGRVLDASDACNRELVQKNFKDARYDIKQLLLAVTQTDAFRYVPVVTP